MGLFSRKNNESGGAKLAPVSGDGTFSFEIAGELFASDAILRVIDGATEAEQAAQQVEDICGLVPEPTNEHDSRAIRVMLRGEFIGYIGRDDLDDIHAAIEEVQKLGYTHMGCKARLTWSDDFSKMSVRLDLERSGA